MSNSAFHFVHLYTVANFSVHLLKHDKLNLRQKIRNKNIYKLNEFLIVICAFIIRTVRLYILWLGFPVGTYCADLMGKIVTINAGMLSGHIPRTCHIRNSEFGISFGLVC